MCLVFWLQQPEETKTRADWVNEFRYSWPMCSDYGQSTYSTNSLNLGDLSSLHLEIPSKKASSFLQPVHWPAPPFSSRVGKREKGKPGSHNISRLSHKHGQFPHRLVVGKWCSWQLLREKAGTGWSKALEIWGRIICCQWLALPPYTTWPLQVSRMLGTTEVFKHQLKLTWNYWMVKKFLGTKKCHQAEEFLSVAILTSYFEIIISS